MEWRSFTNVSIPGYAYIFISHSGPRDLDDRLHDLFILIVHAIRRGDIREPERFMGFVRVVAQRQGWAHIRQVVSKRTEESSLESQWDINAAGNCPERAAITRQREDLARKVLAELSDRDREVLIRFYLKEQPHKRICLEMNLTETQFRLLKSRAKARFGILRKKRLRPHVVSSIC
jgi:RNA polymerase sigma-70 factor (ECF subfamily)